jgi:hypothetical protein
MSSLMQTIERELLDENEAAAYLKLSLATIRRYRYGIGGRTGLRVTRIGRAVRYARSDLDEFIRSCGQDVPTPTPVTKRSWLSWRR